MSVQVFFLIMFSVFPLLACKISSIIVNIILFCDLYVHSLSDLFLHLMKNLFIMPIMLSASVSFKNCFIHPKISYIMFWIYYFMFHMYVFNPPENDFMYSVKYEAKVLFKNLYGYSIDPTLFTGKSILSSLHCNDEFGDSKHRFFLWFLCYVLFVCLVPQQYHSILVTL